MTPAAGGARGALDGLRILDLSTGPVGGVATTVLSDFGADVVKVEPPGGDRFRELAASPLWLRGKRSIVLDLASADGRERVGGLAAAADVLLVSGPPGRDADLGVPFAAMAAAHPALVQCHLTPWGPRGPYARLPGYDALLAAKSGRMRVFGRQRRGDAPGFSALPVAQHACAMGAVQGIAAALLEREATGRGQLVETSLLQGLLPYDLADLLFVQLADRGATDLPDLSAGDLPTLNYHPVRASDGRWIQCGNLMEHLFYAFLDALDLLPELLADERFEGAPGRWAAPVVEEVRDRILGRVAERTADEWMQIFRKNGNVAAEPFLTSEQALAHPDLVANGEIIRSDDPKLGALCQIGPMARLSETPGRIRGPAPEPGADVDEVLADWTPRAGPAGRGAPTRPGEPLHGLRVIDLSTIIAGPLGASMLADLGARVIKVEPISGDPSRAILPGGALATRMNGGKESLAVDLKSDEGRAILAELLTNADVVLHNFRPGVPERLGVGYEACRALNPRVIWAAVQGYGELGPDAGRPATHPVVGAATGGATWQAGPAVDAPCGDLAATREVARQLMRANEANPDPNTSSVLAAAVLLALLARERRGGDLGQRIDVSMLVANAWANADDFVDYAGKPSRPRLDLEILGFAPGYRLYAARTGWVVLAATREKEWCALAEAVGEPALLEPAGRSVDRLAALFATRDAESWERDLSAGGVACVRADGPGPGRFWAEDEHVRVLALNPVTRHAEHGDMLRWGPIVRVGGPAAACAPAPLTGEHTERILAELGRSGGEIAALRSAGTVGFPYPD